jgi:hypothetical protein
VTLSRYWQCCQLGGSHIPASELIFGSLVVFAGGFHISIELRGEVVHRLFSRVLPLGLARFVLESPSVASQLFGNIEAVLAGNNIMVKAQVLDGVINRVAEGLGLSFELVAST